MRATCFGVLLDAGAERGASEITTLLAHGGQGILRNSERFSARAVLAVGWLEHVCDHRNLAYIFSPQSCGVALSKAASQRFAGWRACMSQFNYVIQHIPGKDNHWGNILSRWGCWILKVLWCALILLLWLLRRLATIRCRQKVKSRTGKTRWRVVKLRWRPRWER